ncbi:MAG: hypothetical protein QME49_04650 [bacterium]|nr:hypothetical protein [bacterium]
MRVREVGRSECRSVMGRIRVQLCPARKGADIRQVSLCENVEKITLRRKQMTGAVKLTGATSPVKGK